MIVLSKIRSWFRREHYDIVDADRQPVKVVLIGFAYDEVTTQTARWLKNIKIQKTSVTTVVEVGDINTARQALNELLNEEPATNRVEIFCGHGDFDSLLGPPDNTSSDKHLSSVRHSIFYDTRKLEEAYDIRQEHGRPVQISMFAFCCRSAREFGRKFSSYRNRSFLGFNDDLPLHDDMWDALSDLHAKITQSITRAGRIDEQLERGVLRMYDEAIDSYTSQRRQSRHPFLMKLYLEEHKAQLRQF
jgi:hypothetical protein